MGRSSARAVAWPSWERSLPCRHPVQAEMRATSTTSWRSRPAARRRVSPLMPSSARPAGRPTSQRVRSARHADDPLPQSQSQAQSPGLQSDTSGRSPQSPSPFCCAWAESFCTPGARLGGGPLTSPSPSRRRTMTRGAAREPSDRRLRQAPPLSQARWTRRKTAMTQTSPLSNCRRSRACEPQ